MSFSTPDSVQDASRNGLEISGLRVVTCTCFQFLSQSSGVAHSGINVPAVSRKSAFQNDCWPGFADIMYISSEVIEGHQSRNLLIMCGF